MPYARVSGPRVIRSGSGSPLTAPNGTVFIAVFRPREYARGVRPETTTHHEHGDDLDRLALLADCLLDRGHDVHVCCAQWWDGQPDVFDYDGVTYHAVTPDRGQRWFAPKAAGMVRTLGPDVVHATSRTPGHVYGARWALLAGAPSSSTGTTPPRRTAA